MEKEPCPICNDTGITKALNFDNLILEDKEYSINELMDKYGEFVACIEGCQILN